MKKFVTYLTIVFLLSTALNTKAEVCSGYELRLRDNFQKEEVLNCFNDYNEAKKAMNEYETTDTKVTVIYKNDKLINAKYAFVKLDGFNTILKNDGYDGLTYIYENASDYKNNRYRYTYISADYGSDAAFIDYDVTYDMIKLKISGCTGYVRAKYASIIPIVDMYENTVSPKIDNLTIRGEASSTSTSYGSATKGTKYKYTDIISDGTYDWYKVEINGETRYLAQNKSKTYLEVSSGITLRTYYKTTSTKFYHYYRQRNTSTVALDLSKYETVSDILEKNKIYYSFDGNYFYDSYLKMLEDYKNNNYNQSINKNTPYYAYYQYLPLHSISGYGAEEFNKIVEDNGYTRLPDPSVTYVDANGKFISGIDRKGVSILYGKGESFVTVSQNYGINAFSVFVTALLEGAVGSSELAIAKNNPFGHNAFDGCVFSCATKYNNLEEAIEAHAKTYVSSYGIPTYTYYMGSFLGNKGSGMNVNYASDPYWGEKQSRLSYYRDESYGGSDYNKNTIGIKIKSDAISIYKDPSVTSTVIYTLQNTKYKYKTPNMGLIVFDKVIDSNGDAWYKVYTEIALTDERKVSSDKYTYSFDNSYGYVKAEDLYVKNNQPEINGISNKTVYVNDTFDPLKGVSCIDKEDGNLIDIMSIDGTVNTKIPGKYTLTYSVTDSSRFKLSKTITITVVGDSLPEIKANDITIHEKETFEPLKYVTASDSVDGNITSKVKVISNNVNIEKLGEYSVTYEVTNSKQIKVTKTIKVTVIEDLKPTLYVESLETTLNKELQIKNYITAYDTEDGNLIDKVKITGTINYQKTGIYKINISVSDSYGHTLSKDTYVTVKTFTKKDGAFYLRKMNYNDKTNLLEVSGYLAITGINNTGTITYDLIFKDKNNNKEYVENLNQYISSTYPRNYSDGKYKYDNIWFNGNINLKNIPKGEYTLYIRARKDSYESRNLFRNLFLIDISDKITDDEGRGYYFRNNNYEREFPLEVIIRDDGLISTGETKHSSNMYNSYNTISMSNGSLNITGYSFNINGDYKTSVKRYLVLENIETEKKYTFDIGSTKGNNIALNVDDGMNRSYAWFDTTNKINLSSIEKGNYIVYIRTQSLNGIDDYGELRDIFLKTLPSSAKINNKTYELYLNKDNWFRLELIVK